MSFLGGIFWQLSSDVAGQTPYLLDTKAIVENPWTQLFIDGIDGQQPLLDALENGVDGQGSQPFLELLSDERSISWLRHTITCAVGRMHLSDAGYPTFGVRPDSATVSLIDDYIAKETAGNVIGLLQQGDYQYMKRNNSDIKQIIQTETDVTYYWLAVTRWVAKDLLNPFMNCSGYPEFSDGSRRLLQLVERPQQQPRRLVTIGDIGIGDAMYDLVGVGARDFVSTTTEIVHRLHSCDNRACRWIGEKYNDTVKLGENTFTAVMSVVNILGALFFMVANLGFASYDALLTFPQERSLFNRESANGLYRASSYFLAKNIADLPFQLIPSFVLVTIYYLFIGIGTTAGQYFIYFLTCAGISFAAYGFGYLVSAASPRMEIAVLVAPIILVIWLTIAGFFLRDEQIPRWIGWLSYISFYKWGFFSLVINQFPPDGYFGLLSNRIPLLMAGITNTRLWSTMLILFSLGFCYRFVGYLALRYTNRSVGLQS